MKKIVQLFFIVFILLLSSCVQNNVNSTNFEEYVISNKYSVELPDYLNKKSTEFWQSPSHEKNIKNIEIKIVKTIEDINIEELVVDLAEKDTREIFQNKKFVKNENFESNGLSGIISYYKKDNNSGVIPIMTYFVYGVIKDKGFYIEFSSVSLIDDFQEDMKTSILSIYRIQEDTLINQNESTSISKNAIDVNKAKQEGYQVFDKENFIVKCPAKFQYNKDYIEVLQSQGLAYNNVVPYIATLNKNSYEKGVIYNINVQDHSVEYKTLKESHHSSFKHNFLEEYISNLRANNIGFQKGKIDNQDCIYYSFSQYDLPTKAVLIFYNQSTYLFQIGTRYELDTYFKDFTESIKFIK